VTVPIIDQSGLDAVVEAYAKGAQVNVPVLAWLDFAANPQAVWPGEYPITKGGVTWQGLGKAGFLIGVDNHEGASTLEASTFNVNLSGVDNGILAAAASTNRADYINRLLIIYALFCDADWQPIANPMAIGGGFMGPMSITRNLSGNENDATWVRSITLPVANMFYGRGVPRNSFWTDADQQQRYPSGGDTGLQFINQLQDFTIKLPWRS
jgi:hypothetical protein